MKVFLILQIGAYRGESPYTNYRGIFKDRYWATEEELLELNLSESIKKRIRGAKVGTKIKIGHQSSSSDIYLKRVADDYLIKKEEIFDLMKRRYKINKEIRLKCIEEYEELDRLDKEEKMARKELSKIEGLKGSK